MKYWGFGQMFFTNLALPHSSLIAQFTDILMLSHYFISIDKI